MPAPLPTNWTREHTPDWAPQTYNGAVDEGWQILSFCIALLLLSAWGLRRIWRGLRQDVPWLPELNYWRSLGAVIVWGLAFVVVLAMISGTRELITPGAWRKQGWTYQLADQTSSKMSDLDGRRAALFKLRAALVQHAESHEGRFPAGDDPAIPADLWSIPGHPGLRFLAVPERVKEEAGRLVVFEPALDGGERLVLLTNGVVGTMTGDEIRRAIGRKEAP
jgi:hypothetical protein